MDRSHCPWCTTTENGKQVLKFLPEDQAKIDDVEARTKAIMLRLGAEPGTQNIDRILRLSGTTNLTNKVKRDAGRVECPTRLLAFNGSSYSPDAFPLPEENKPGTAEDGGHHARQEHADEDKLERIIRDRDSNEFKTRSHAMWWVINELLRLNVPTTVIVSTLLDRNNTISAHVNEQPNPRQYAERQVAEARAKIPSAKVEVLPPSQWIGEKPAPIPPALIKSVLPQTGVAMIGGQSGGGKTFHALHLGVRLIPDCEQNFYIDQYRIKRKGGVLYLVLEGKPAFPMRVTAAFEDVLNKQMQFGERAKLPFAWNT
jgi:AAA domain